MLFSGAPSRGSLQPDGRQDQRHVIWNALTHSENAVSLRVLRWVLDTASLADYQAWGKSPASHAPFKAIRRSPAEIKRRWGWRTPWRVRPEGRGPPCTWSEISDRNGRASRAQHRAERSPCLFGDTILALWDDARASRASSVKRPLIDKRQPATGRRA